MDDKVTVKATINLKHARQALALGAGEDLKTWLAKSDQEVIAAVLKHCRCWGVTALESVHEAKNSEKQ